MSTTETSLPANVQVAKTWSEEDSRVARIESALAGVMPVQSFLSQFYIACLRPDVACCTPRSLFDISHLCATLALLPTLDQVALIPREIKDSGGQYECTAMVTWQGYKALMERHEDVAEVRARLVHKDDQYEYDADTGQILNHSFDPFDDQRDVSNLDCIKGGYLIVEYNNGRRDTHHVVTAATIVRARSCSESWSSARGRPYSPWTKFPDTMALKTIFRDSFARRVVPFDPFTTSQLQKAIEADDVALENDPANAVTPSTEPMTKDEPPTDSRADHVADAFGVGTDEPPTETDAWEQLLGDYEEEARAATSLEAVNEAYNSWIRCRDDVPEDVLDKASKINADIIKSLVASDGERASD